MNPRRLYRCRHDRVLAGVASGMAEYLDVDPTLVRILWIISAFFGGFTILLYILFAFIMPLEPVYAPAPSPAPGPGPAPTPGPSETTATDEAAPDANAATGYAPSAQASGQPYPAWTHEPPAHDHGGRRSGRAGLYLGVMLIVFGAIAAVNAIVPGIASGALIGAAVLVGLGAALLVGAARPGATDPSNTPES